MKTHKKTQKQSSHVDVEQIFPILFNFSKIDFNLYKLPTLKRAIHKRIVVLNLKNFQNYLQYIKKHPQEAEILSKSMLIKVTKFFRDSEVFQLLRQKVFSQLKRNDKEPIRIWVPGCCTGEEVYSLAMALTDYLQGKNSSIHIFGTDLSEDSLNKARAGIYNKKELSGLPRKYINRHFTFLNGHYYIDKNIRSMCTFAKQDLIHDAPFSHLDMISCRNVLIYLKPEIQDKIIKIFHYALNPKGVLILGKSENIGILNPRLFDLVDKKQSIYIKKPGTANSRMPLRVMLPSKNIPEDFKSFSSPQYRVDINREMDRMLIERSGHAAILINEANEIIQSRGNITIYFQIPSGKMSAHVLRMANEDIAIELEMLIKKARKSHHAANKTIETRHKKIDLEVVPLNKSLLKERNLLILISPHQIPIKQPQVPSRTSFENKKIQHLQRELAATKAWMQNLAEEHENTVQDLKSSHEEILSSNEELQSLNEELQTSQEELESTNEELTTVNEQLQQQMEALRQSEERFRVLIESVKDYAIFMLDLRGHIMTWNLGAERIKGYKTQEIVGKHLSIFYVKKDYRQVEKELRIAAQKGVYKEEGLRVRKDGSKFWARVILTALRDKNNKLTGFVKVTYDMTEQKEAEERLRQSEEKFRLMIENVKEYAIFLLDPKGCIATWNLGAERLKGYTPKEVIGKHFSIFYPEPDQLKRKPQKELAYATKHGEYKEEGWRVRKDGSMFWASLTITALKDREGKLRGFSKVTRDMTERMRTEELLRHTNTELEKRVKERTEELERKSDELMRSNADLQQFAYVASHDLQEPLRTVSVYADLLERYLKNNPNPKIRECLQFLKEGSIRSQRLIRELLEYSRIDIKSEPFAKVEMNEVFNHVLFLLDRMIKEGGARITSDPLPLLIANRLQMEQLLQNLISNSIKYRSQNQPEIHISARKDTAKPQWLFSVKDNGIGIAPQYSKIIFTVFKRLHTTNEYPGTGIGLALCKKIVKRHGGDIWVESQEGKGATFFFTLPERQEVMIHDRSA